MKIQSLNNNMELGDLLYGWKTKNHIIQHKSNKGWYDLKDSQVIKELIFYKMSENIESYRLKPSKNESKE
jgi:hypothetical protein